MSKGRTPSVETIAKAQDGRFSVTNSLTTVVKERVQGSDLGTCITRGIYSQAAQLTPHRTTLGRQRFYID